MRAPSVARVADEAGGRIDRARGADRDEQVGLAQRGVDLVHPVGHLAEPDDVGPQRARAARRARRAGRSAARSSGGARRRRCTRRSDARRACAARARAPARSCRSSTFWVTISSSPLPLRDRAAPARGARRWAAWSGSPRGACRRSAAPARDRARRPRAWRRPRPGAAPTARRRSRKVSIPLSALTPAPVRMTMLRMPAIAAHEARAVGEMAMARIGIIGSEGRMGHALAARDRRGRARLRRRGRPGRRRRGAGAGERRAGRFLRPGGARGQPRRGDRRGHRPILVGTTGLDERHHCADRSAPRQTIPVLQTGNTSLGVTLLAHLVREAAARLGAGLGHRDRRDAPPDEGRRAVAAPRCCSARRRREGRGDRARGEQRARPRRHHRRARAKARSASPRLRGGTVAGDHQRDPRRRARAADAVPPRREPRRSSPSGAIKARRWLIGRPAGRYTMAQVLGL